MAKCDVPARLQARVDAPIKAHTTFVVALTVARSAAAIATGALRRPSGQHDRPQVPPAIPIKLLVPDRPTPFEPGTERRPQIRQPSGRFTSVLHRVAEILRGEMAACGQGAAHVLLAQPHLAICSRAPSQLVLAHIINTAAGDHAVHTELEGELDDAVLTPA